MNNGGYASPGSTMPAQGMGFQTPGFFQAGLGAAGFFASSHQRYADQAASTAQLGSLGGDAAANFLSSTLPGVAGAGLMIGGAAAPILRAMGRGTGRAWMGVAGTALDAVDPFTYAFGGAKMGFRAGVGLAGRGAAYAAGGITSIGARGLAGGIMGGIAGAAAPLALATGATLATGYALEQMGEGNRQYQATKQFLVNRGSSLFGASVNPMGGMASDMQQTLHAGARSLGTQDETIREITRFLDDQGYFKTVSSMKEFREKFDKALSAIKTIAKEMQTTIEDATNTFGQIRQQGFYQAADIGQQARRQGALAAATGREQSQVAAMGAYGAQMSRRFGMRGRFGAEFAQNVQAAVDMGLRNGTLDEETVMENGGPEAVAAQLAQAQMRFLRTSRGRMMMANALESGSSNVGTSRIMNLVGGDNSMQGLVQGAVNRGLGTLYRTGTPEARQNFMQYAGMAMVNTAMSERQMLGMSTDRSGLIMGLRQQGLSADQASMLLGQVSNLGNVMAEQRSQENLARQRREFDELSSRYSLVSRTKSWMRETVADPMQYVGMRIGEEADQWANSFNEWWTGRRELRVGGTSSDYVRRGADVMRNLGPGGFGAGRERSRAPFGVPSANERFAEAYSDYELKGLSPSMAEAFEKSLGARTGYAIRDPSTGAVSVQGKILDREGNEYMSMGGGKFIRADALDLDFEFREGGRRADLTEEGAARLAVDARSGASAKYTGQFHQTADGFAANSLDRMTYGAISSLGDDPLAYEMRGMTFSEYQALPPEQKARYEGAISRALPGDSEFGKRYRAAVGDRGSYFTTTQGAEDAYRESMGKLMAGNMEAVDATASDDRAREALDKAFRIALEGDSAEEVDYAAYQDAFDALGDELSGQALSDARARLDKVYQSSGEERKQLQALYKKAGGAGAALAYGRQMDRSRSMVNDAFKAIGRGPNGEDAIRDVFGDSADEARALRSASRRNDNVAYEQAWEKFAFSFAEDGKIDADEIKLMAQASGGQGGEFQLATTINALVGKDEGARSEALKALGYGGADLEEMLGMDAKDLLARVGRERQLTPGGGDGKGALSIEGMEDRAWHRQKEFVIAVDAFMTKFKETKLGTSVFNTDKDDTVDEPP